MSVYIPPCCTQLSHAWLLPEPLASACMVSCRFEPSLWQAEQFELAGVPPARGRAKRQSEFLAGRICAREALAVVRGQRSVPTVGEDGAPCWPSGLCGSISHGKGFALAAVAEQSHVQSLGLDIEALLAVERAERLAGEIHTPAELEPWQALAAERRAWLTTLTFSAKESVFKALYPLVQRRFYFQDAELLDWQADGHLRLRLLIDLHPDWPAGTIVSGQYAEFDGRLLTLLTVPAKH